MKRSLLLAALMTVSGSMSVASAAAISKESEIQEPTLRITFDEVRKMDQRPFGASDVGQPYAKLGLVLPSQVIDARADLTPVLKVGVRSTNLSTADNSTYQSLAFTVPQRIVALNVRSEKATSIRVTAYDKSGNVVGESVLPASGETQFTGFVLEDPCITVVRVVAMHETLGDAMNAPTFVSGVIMVAMFEHETDDKLSSSSEVQYVGSQGAGSPLSVGGEGFGGGGAGGGGSGGNKGGGGAANPTDPEAAVKPTPNLPEPSSLGAVGAVGTIALRRTRRVAGGAR